MKPHKIDIDFSIEYPLPGIYAGEAQWEEACYEAVIWFDPGEPVTWECPGTPPHWTDVEEVRLVDEEVRLVDEDAKDEARNRWAKVAGPDISHQAKEPGCPWWEALEAAADAATEELHCDIPSTHRFYY